MLVTDYDRCSKNVFKCFLKDWSAVAVTTCSGKEFQIRGATTGKARLPTVDSLTDGTTKRLVTADRRARRLGRSTTEVSGPGPKIPRRAAMKNLVRD